MFGNSEVQKYYSEEKLNLFYKELLPDEEWVPQVLLADPAYLLLAYVIKEYDTCRSSEEVIFNQMLRSARNQIECAFGRLKARRQILPRPLDNKLDNVPNLIYAWFVLHNFCERKKIDNFGETDRIMAQEKRQQSPADKVFLYFTCGGGKVRDAISKYLQKYL